MIAAASEPVGGGVGAAIRRGIRGLFRLVPAVVRLGCARHGFEHRPNLARPASGGDPEATLTYRGTRLGGVPLCTLGRTCDDRYVSAPHQPQQETARA